jgi:hypothetical protein
MTSSSSVQFKRMAWTDHFVGDEVPATLFPPDLQKTTHFISSQFGFFAHRHFLLRYLVGRHGASFFPSFLLSH